MVPTLGNASSNSLVGPLTSSPVRLAAVASVDIAGQRSERKSRTAMQIRHAPFFRNCIAPRLGTFLRSTVGTHRASLVIGLTLTLAVTAVAGAQTPPAAVDDPNTQTDLVDLWLKIRGRSSPDKPREERRVTFVVAPAFGANPTFGATFGVAAQIAFRLGEADATRQSSSVASLTFSTKGQTLFNGRYSAFTRANRWFVEGDNRCYVSGQEVYPLGSDSPSESGVQSKYRFLRLHNTLLRHVGNDVYIGGGLLFDSHTHIRPADAAVDAWPGSAF